MPPPPAEGRPRVRTLDLGLACCAVEVARARTAVERFLAADADAQAGRSAPQGAAVTDVLVIAGTLTDAMASLVLAQYEDLAAEAGTGLRVVSFGSCANTGGPYWDSYAVTKGVDQLLPVDAYVAGCPPHPDAVREALLTLGLGSGAAPVGEAHRA